MLDLAERSKKLQGMKIGSRGPAISHLLFADDLLLFTLANKKATKSLHTVLRDYEQGSGQAVNLRKSAITFGQKVKPEMKRYARHHLGIHNDGGRGTYLGLPEQIEKKKTEVFRYIVDRVRQRTEVWSAKLLSQGGKETLIKSVAMAMPVYTMNLFRLPKELCTEINNVLAKFWWKTTPDSRGMHWFAWDRLSLPKREGGLGFRELDKFNLAMLGKQIWRILQNPTCLMARVLKGRYFHDANILTAKQGHKASYIWKSLLHGRDLVIKGIRFNVGDGTMISAWHDPWLPTSPPRPPRKRAEDIADLSVNDFFNATGSDWDVDKVNRFVDPADIQTILDIKLSVPAQQDVLGWHYTQDGRYTVKSAY